MKFERIYLIEGREDVYLDTYVADPIRDFTRRAILVIPGGGYRQVCSDREGEPIAMAFMPYGYNAFVLHYSVDRKAPFPQQLIEVALAIKHIKDNAKEYDLDPEELFVVGFSAGGHLCASAGILWKLPEIYEAVDMPYGYNKPKGIMPIYPVVSGDPAFGHQGSIKNLWCCDEPSDEQREQVSLERYVDADSAPAFIVHSQHDQIVNVRNSFVLAQAYAEAGVDFDMHIFSHIPHGAGLGNEITWHGHPEFVHPAFSEWVRMAAQWAENLSNYEK